MTRKSLIGASGLEGSFERFLQGVGPTTVSYFVDGRGNPLNGLKAALRQQDNQFYPLSLIATIDNELQKKVEQLMIGQKIKRGSAIVLDAHSREVLAMASLPEFHPSKINMEEGNWVNRAIKQTVPGSVFKTVVAAAVLRGGTCKTRGGIPLRWSLREVWILLLERGRTWRAYVYRGICSIL